MNEHSKPCKCGRPGCKVIRRDNERAWNFGKRKFAGRSCAAWWDNMNNPDRFEHRSKGGKVSVQALKAGKWLKAEAGAVVTPVEWLDLPPVRLRLALEQEPRR